MMPKDLTKQPADLRYAAVGQQDCPAGGSELGGARQEGQDAGGDEEAATIRVVGRSGRPIQDYLQEGVLQIRSKVTRMLEEDLLKMAVKTKSDLEIACLPEAAGLIDKGKLTFRYQGLKFQACLKRTGGRLPRSRARRTRDNGRDRGRNDEGGGCRGDAGELKVLGGVPNGMVEMRVRASRGGTEGTQDASGEAVHIFSSLGRGAKDKKKPRSVETRPGVEIPGAASQQPLVKSQENMETRVVGRGKLSPEAGEWRPEPKGKKDLAPRKDEVKEGAPRWEAIGSKTQEKQVPKQYSRRSRWCTRRRRPNGWSAARPDGRGEGRGLSGAAGAAGGRQEVHRAIQVMLGLNYNRFMRMKECWEAWEEAKDGQRGRVTAQIGAAPGQLQPRSEATPLHSVLPAYLQKRVLSKMRAGRTGA